MDLEVSTSTSVDNIDDRSSSPFLEEGVYNVEKIVGRRTESDGQTTYRVRWEGYGSDQDTWEPIENLANCMQLVEQFLEVMTLNKHKKKVQRKKSVDEYHRHSSSKVPSIGGVENLRLEREQPSTATLTMHSSTSKRPLSNETVSNATSKARHIDNKHGMELSSIGTESDDDKPLESRFKKFRSEKSDKLTFSSSSHKIVEKLDNHSGSSLLNKKRSKMNTIVKQVKAIQSNRIAKIVRESDSKVKVSASISRPCSRGSSLGVPSACTPSSFVVDSSLISAEKKETADLQAFVEMSFNQLDPKTKQVFLELTQAYRILDIATERSKNYQYEVTKILSPKTKSEARSMLKHAIKECNEESVEKILNKFRPFDLGLNETLTNENAPILFTCCYIKCDEKNDHAPCRIIENLFVSLVDINARNIKGETALIVAARKGLICKVEKLLSVFAKIDAVDHKQETALFAAIRWCPEDLAPKMLKTLLKHGADYRLENKDGLTAIAVALSLKKMKLKDIIEEHKEDLESKFLNHVKAVHSSYMDIMDTVIPLRFLEVRSKYQWRKRFDVKELILPPGYSIILFVSLIKFMGDGSFEFYTNRKSTPIDKVYLNKKEMRSFFNHADYESTYVMEPLQDNNEFLLNMGDSQADFVRLGIQVNVVKLKHVL